MYNEGMIGKKKESYRIDLPLKFQIDNYADAHGLDRQEVIARAVKLAHPLLARGAGTITPYAHLRRKKVDSVESVVITPKLTAETLGEIEAIKRSTGRSGGQVLTLALHHFFKEAERTAAGTLTQGALSTFLAPTYHLAEVSFQAPWIESVPLGRKVEHNRDLIPDRMQGRTVYVGADFFLTMMTCLEMKHGPRSRTMRGSEEVVRAAARATLTLVTTAAELARFAVLGGALEEARDVGHFSELIKDSQGGRLPARGGVAVAQRMRSLKKLGVRVIPTELEDYVSACEFLRVDSQASFSQLLGLATLWQIEPADSVILRFMKSPGEPLLLVWQEFSDGRLERMSSRDVEKPKLKQ